MGVWYLSYTRIRISDFVEERVDQRLDELEQRLVRDTIPLATKVYRRPCVGGCTCGVDDNDDEDGVTFHNSAPQGVGQGGNFLPSIGKDNL